MEWQTALSGSVQSQSVHGIFRTHRTHSNGGGTVIDAFVSEDLIHRDFLRPQITATFLKTTHPQYYKYFGDDFCSNVQAVFSDEALICVF